MFIQSITASELEKICKDGEIGSTVAGSSPPIPQVIVTTDGLIVKLVYKKLKLFAAKKRRLNKILKQLHKLQIPTIAAIEVKYCHTKQCYVIIYNKLPGEPSEKYLLQHPDLEIYKKVCEFFAMLHEKGIVHKDFHFNNILYSKENGFYLIDINSVKFKPTPLEVEIRAKGFAQMAISAKELIVKYGGVEKLQEYYLAATTLSEAQQQEFKDYVRKINQ